MLRNKERAKSVKAQIDDLILAMGDHDPNSAEYKELFRKAEVLTKLFPQKDRRISPDAYLAAATTLGGILIIVAYEHAHPLASKALSFVTKVK